MPQEYTDAMELPSSAASGESATLPAGSIAMWKVLVLALSGLQIGPSLAAGSGAQLFAGSGSWLSNTLALTCMLLVASAIAVYARRFVVTGSMVSYAQQAFGHWGQVVTGGALLLGYFTALAALISADVIFLTNIMVDAHIGQAVEPWVQCALAVIVTAASILAGSRGLEASARLTMWLGFACLPVIAGVSIALALRHGIQLHDQLILKDATGSGVFEGTVVSLGMFVGFDGLTSLAAETKDPRKNVPRVLILCLLLVGLSTLFLCFLQTPALLQHLSELYDGQSPITILAGLGQVGYLGPLNDVLLLLGTFAGNIAFINFGGHVIATAAKDGLLPGGLAIIDPYRRSPKRAILFYGIASGTLPIVLQLLFRTPPILTNTYVTNVAVYAWLLPYTIVCCGAIFVEWRSGRPDWKSVTASAIGAGAIGYILLAALCRPGAAGSVPRWTMLMAVSAALWFHFVSRKKPLEGTY